MPENEEKTPLVDPARVNRAAFPPNSKKSKEGATEEGKVKPKIVPLEGVTAVKQKPKLASRLRQAFTGDDARGVGDYLLFEVAVPAIKTVIFDMISQGANRALFGQSVGIPGNGSRRPGQVNYNLISRNGGTTTPSREISSRDMATHNFDNIVLQTRAEAELVLSSLIDIVDRYDVAAVSDLYELVQITGSYADDKWGWFDLRGATITSVRDGFVLDLPATKPIR